jgi:hypothetical protein
MKQTSCFGCRHFVITYNARRPYACRAFGFETVRVPSLEVMAASGKPCQKREESVAGWAQRSSR